MKTLWLRLQSPTPKFWKRVRALGVFLTSAGGAMAAAPEGLPGWISAAGGYLVVAGGVTVALASITCTDTPTDQQ